MPTCERGWTNVNVLCLLLALVLSSVSCGLDRLGNWTQGAGQTDGGGAFVYAGRVEESDDDLDGEYEAGELVEARAHSADLRNRLTEVETDTGGGPSAEAIVYDLAGNLVADDVYWYQYDAFNRLACVRLKGTLEFDADGFVEDGEPGAWRANFAYDALGRLVSKQVPWGAQGADERWCWYYYDGVRRIVEVFRDPLVTGGGIGGGVPTGNYTTYTDREYVWGPEYVDECLWQIDKVGDAAFVLQDANYNVVGLVDDEGGLLRQYAWDPYGQAIAVDSLGIFGHNRLGHQGLFFDRLDANAPNADLTATARGVYYARNRNYEPRLGRWLQGDPNGTAAVVTSGGTYHGASTLLALGHADLLVHYQDGLNGYALVGSKPLTHRDPAGLSLAGGLLSGLGIASNVLDAVDTAYMGVSAGFQLGGMAEDYNFALEMAIEWALDWDSDDDLFSYGGDDDYDYADDSSGPSYAAFGKNFSRFSFRIKRSSVRAGGSAKSSLVQGIIEGRVRPPGIPSGWKAGPSDRGGGVMYKPTTGGVKGGGSRYVRIMPGNPASKFHNSRSPYVRWQNSHGQSLDANGRVLPTVKCEEAHFPIEQFRWRLIESVLGD
ncbi:MAG TPA: hypothetical protein PLU35_08170 [Phycisphaerales bacterium]|nr:hypothetical protein [Phycisphaerales bacterium]